MKYQTHEDDLNRKERMAHIDKLSPAEIEELRAINRRLAESELLNESFRDLGDGDQWRYLRLSTVNRIRILWKYRNGLPNGEGQHPYVTAAIARGFIREEVARLREYRANSERERS